MSRPGGWLVARAPGASWAVEDLPRSARSAGLEVAGTGGCFMTTGPWVSTPFFLDLTLRKPTTA
jgi:hypothetical protein